MGCYIVFILLLHIKQTVCGTVSTQCTRVHHVFRHTDGHFRYFPRESTLVTLTSMCRHVLSCQPWYVCVGMHLLHASVITHTQLQATLLFHICTSHVMNICLHSVLGLYIASTAHFGCPNRTSHHKPEMIIVTTFRWCKIANLRPSSSAVVDIFL